MEKIYQLKNFPLQVYTANHPIGSILLPVVARRAGKKTCYQTTAENGCVEMFQRIAFDVFGKNMAATKLGQKLATKNDGDKNMHT